MNYIVIPHLAIQRANVLATPWLLSPCPVFAATLLGHALGRDTGIFPIGVGLVHHDAALLAEEHLPKGYGGVFPQQYRSASLIDKSDYVGNTVNLSLQPTCSANLEVSLVLAYAAGPPAPSAIVQALRHRRLAGGLITDHGKVVVCDSMRGNEGVNHYLKSGFWTRDRSAQLLPDDRLGSLLALVYPSTQPHIDKPDPESPDAGKRPWLVPAVLGYAMLTPFANRSGTREGVPHAFAEPLVGLVEYQPASHLEQADHANLFWCAHWQDHEAYLVTQPSI